MSRPASRTSLVVLHDPLRRQRGGRHDALLLDLTHPLHHQVGLDRLLVDRLHLTRGDLLRELGDPCELLLGIRVAAEDALEIQDGKATELADDARGARRDDAVHCGRHERQLKAVVAELPRDVDVVGIPGAPRGHNCDVVKPVGAAGLLATTDLDLHGATS